MITFSSSACNQFKTKMYTPDITTLSNCSSDFINSPQNQFPIKKSRYISEYMILHKLCSNCIDTFHFIRSSILHHLSVAHITVDIKSAYRFCTFDQFLKNKYADSCSLNVWLRDLLLYTMKNCTLMSKLMQLNEFMDQYLHYKIYSIRS